MGGAPDVDGFIRSEWTIQTGAAIVVLLCWRSCRSSSRQAAAKALLSGWLNALLSFEDFAQCVQHALRQETVGQCEAFSVDSVCSHIRAAAMPQGCNTAWPKIADSIVSLHLVSDSCPAARAALAILAALMEQRLSHNGHQRVLQSVAMDPCKGKRRRKDEAAAEAVITKSRKQFMSSSVFARAHEVAGARTPSAWEDRGSSQALSATWLTFANSLCISVALDAKRLGNPVEEIVAYAAWASGSNRAAWLPLQAAVGPWQTPNPMLGGRGRWPLGAKKFDASGCARSWAELCLSRKDGGPPCSD